jgi:hypothetical protein
MVISIASLLSRGAQERRRDRDHNLKCVRGFSRRRRFRSRPQFRVLTSLHVGLGTDADTAFRVPESGHGPTAGRSDASKGFQSGLCLRVRTIWDLRRAFQSILLHRAALPGHFLGNRHSEHKDPHRTDGIKRTPLVAERLLPCRRYSRGLGAVLQPEWQSA